MSAAPSSWYRFDDGRHVYGCALCNWKRYYPKDRAGHDRLGAKAVVDHFRACHPGAAFSPVPASTAPDMQATEAERELMDVVGRAIVKAAKDGVHVGDRLAIVAAAFCGSARAAGLTLKNAHDVITAWWGND